MKPLEQLVHAAAELLAAGHPVTVERLAAATGRSSGTCSMLTRDARTRGLLNDDLTPTTRGLEAVGRI